MLLAFSCCPVHEMITMATSLTDIIFISASYSEKLATASCMPPAQASGNPSQRIDHNGRRIPDISDGEYDLDRFETLTPCGHDFRMYVTPSILNHYGNAVIRAVHRIFGRLHFGNRSFGFVESRNVAFRRCCNSASTLVPCAYLDVGD